jgi:hypothetical protein
MTKVGVAVILAIMTCAALQEASAREARPRALTCVCDYGYTTSGLGQALCKPRNVALLDWSEECRSYPLESAGNARTRPAAK